MTKEQYKAALDKLGLKPSSRITAAVLCCSTRQLVRYAAGTSAVPLWLERLLFLLQLRSSIPRAWLGSNANASRHHARVQRRVTLAQPPG